jgi:sialic acid synthase SpsE/mannose-6-phosphate isomerase-like protein (cupin superfamily)
MSIFENTRSKPLLILDLANNHNGSLEHGRRIISAIRESVGEQDAQIAIKFQYRELDTFIHPNFKGRQDIKYVKRFESTRLSWDDFRRLVDFVRAMGFLAACTPFDEASVRRVVEHDYDILKVASASFTDWPLLEEVVGTDLPIVASTAAASVDEIDRVATFLSHRKKDFALMHCVAAYPTADSDLQLNRIDLLTSRYQGVPVGYSTHENPNNMAAVQMAVAKGARILERHVGIGTSNDPLNDYSSTPDTVGEWVAAIRQALAMCGRTDGSFTPVAAEVEALQGLRRGAFAKKSLADGSRVGIKDVFFAIPLQEGQVVANEWSKYSTRTVQGELRENDAVLNAQIQLTEEQDLIWRIVQRARELFAGSGVTLPQHADLEISHHYGLDRFEEVGLLMVTVINRDYCKKLLGLLPGQVHPEQFHNMKEETFHCLSGDVDLWLNDVHRTMRPGDVVTVQPGVRHRFSSKAGCVIEEISSTHFKDDSYYTDDSISKNPNRKTFVSFWN